MRTLSITQELGRFETFFSDVIYPAWPVWLVVGITALAIAAVTAYRLGWHRIAAQHRVLTAVSLAAIIGISAPVGVYTISPLFDRNTVCEVSPIAGAGTGSDKCDDIALAVTMPPTFAPTAEPTAAETSAPTSPPTPAPFAAHEISRGEFISADDFHYTYGTALLIETAPNTYTLRFEDFSVRNGPDVFVLLSPTEGYTGDALNLGSLKGTDGAFNYDVPPGADVSQYKSAIIWCRQFDVLFGHATLTPV